MKTSLGYFLVGFLLLGAAATIDAAEEENSRATHTVLVEIGTFTW